MQNPFGWRFTAPLLIGATLNPINSAMIPVSRLLRADLYSNNGITEKPS